MAFDPESLCVLSYARGRRQPRGFTHWYYWTDDPGALLAPGFFDAASDLMRPGDIVFAGGTGGAIQLSVVSVREGAKRPGHVYREGGAVHVAEMCGTKSRPAPLRRRAAKPEPSGAA